MKRKSGNKTKKSFGVVCLFLLVGAAVFFGAQWVTKTGFFSIPGVVYYDESLNEDELAVLGQIFTDDIKLDKDVTISASESFKKPDLEEGEFLYEISVPVTDFYSTDSNIDVEEPSLLYADAFVQEVPFEMISVDELDFTKHLLSINNDYYLDDYNHGAVFRTIKFESENYLEEIEPLVLEKFEKKWPDEVSVLTFAQTGVTALSRGMNQKLYSVGDATYFAEGIGNYLSSFDLTHTSNESSFSDYASSSNICSDPRFIDTLTAIGLDVVELTGNHNLDCGDEAAIETIDTYINNGIQIVGGGKSAAEAAEPLQINQKETGITMLAYNLSTGGATEDETPGANQYDESNATEQIKAAKARGDIVIVDIQYYECNAYASEYEDETCDRADSAAGDQVGFFRHLIELGADVVVGTSAHQPQTFELYEDGAIYYGLGNLFFDQINWPGTTRSLVLEHYLYNGKLLQTRITPTVYDANMQTTILDADTAKWFIDRLLQARP